MNLEFSQIAWEDYLWFLANEPKLIKKINPPQPTTDALGYMKGYDLNFAAVTARCMKIVMVPVNKLPPWHRGKGQNGWAFIDEIFLN